MIGSIKRGLKYEEEKDTKEGIVIWKKRDKDIRTRKKEIKKDLARRVNWMIEEPGIGKVRI